MNDIRLEIKGGALEVYADDSTVSLSGKTIKKIETKSQRGAVKARWLSM